MPKPEAKTRKELIDPAITKAGWNLMDPTQVGFEIPVDGEDAEPRNGVTDYVLWRENGDVLAVVEAKKSSFESRLAQQQLDHYLTEIAKRQSFRPFGFLANGVDLHFWDNDSPPRPVHGFFSREDLEGLLFARQNGQPLVATEIDMSIVNRDYQLEAVKRSVRRVCRGEAAPGVARDGHRDRKDPHGDGGHRSLHSREPGA